MTRPRFKGALAKRIFLKPAPAQPSATAKLLYPEQVQAYITAHASWLEKTKSDLLVQRLGKMNTLMEHYGIDPKSEEKWPILALALAADHVPGFQFQFKKSAGRKTDWDDLWYGVLYHEVEKVRGRRSASAACGILSKHTWNGKRLRPGTLENRYSQALKSAVVKARKHAQKGDPQLHQQIVEIWEQISQTLHQKTSTK